MFPRKRVIPTVSRCAMWPFASARSRRDVFRRQHGKVLRRSQQSLGVDTEAAAAMASGKSGLNRSQPRCHQERTGGRGNAVRTLRGQCCLAAAGGADLQPTDRSEATGTAAGAAYSTAQAAALSDLQHSGEISASRAPHPAAVGAELATVFQLARCPALAAFAGWLMVTQCD